MAVTAIYLLEMFLWKKYKFKRQIKYMNTSDWHHILRGKSTPKTLYPLHKLDFNFFFHPRELHFNFKE